MNDYIESRLDFEPCTQDITDLAAAFLAEAGFESFVPDEKGLTAYRPVALGKLPEVDELLRDFPIAVKTTMTVRTVEGRDWNAEWERNYFKPIVVGGDVVVHSSFHTDLPTCRYDIVINPKMAFGTGHHATTEQMMQRLLSEGSLEGKEVIDMGTGTGILAILAVMRGSRKVTAIEIDPVACINARENVQLNGVADSVTLLEGDADLLKTVQPAALLLANINRNIIIADIKKYAAALQSGGTMLLSGFYTADVAMIEQAARDAGLTYADHTQINDWACVKLTK